MAADDTERQLGILIGQMAGITGSLADINRRLDKSDESRKGLHGRLDAVAADMSEVKTSVATIEMKVDGAARDIEEMKPEVALVRGLKAKAAGAVIVLGALGAFAAWLIEHFWDPIRAALMRMFH
jgi:hypothetical protein